MTERVAGIFVPVYYREEKTKKCLASLLKTEFKKNQISLNIIFNIGINGAEETLYNYIMHDFQLHAKQKNFQITIHPWRHNHGKPKAVNMMVNHVVENTTLDYVASCDSDIILINSDWLVDTIYAFETFNDSKRKLGALCPDQLQDNCHVLKNNVNTYKWENNEIQWKSGNVGTAGGVLITPYKVWQELKGYTAHRIYGSDDGHYADLCSRKGYIMAVLKTVKVIHPHERDQGYNRWKRSILQDKLTNEDKKGYKFINNV